MLHRITHSLVATGVVASSFAMQARAQSAQTVARAAELGKSIAPYLAPAMPSEIASAKKADRIAWLSYDRGERNVYAAAAPDFKPVRLTKFTGDDGVTLSELEISEDGSTVVFVRGSEPNRSGWLANPSSNANGPERAIWFARSNGTGAWKLADGNGPALSPDGKSVAFVKEGQIYRLRVSEAPASTPIDKAEQPYVREWGRNASPRWSPDGSKLAFVSLRDNHSLIGVFDVKTRHVDYLAPGVDFDNSPTWSGDSKRIAFVRKPGTPFGMQAQSGNGSLGNPGGPAARAGGQGGRRGNGGGGASGDPRAGMFRAAFRGGYNTSLMVAEVARPDSATEFWHNAADDRTFVNVNNITWAGDAVIFTQEPQEWVRMYSVKVDGGGAPSELTPGEGALESFGLSSDGRTLFYASNVNDIDRRHIWRVPTSGGQATQITSGEDIDMYPAPLASGKQVAVLTSGAMRPMQVGLVGAEANGARKNVFPVLSKDYLALAQVAPTNVQLKADDGVEFHNQLFLPKDMKPGERRPAVVFVHGGPVRQMLLGYHYMDFYHTAYAVNEWLASQGYVVMSVNYRSGIGYGKSFRNAANVGGRGNAEYKDVIAAGKYLQTRADVDPGRIGIWGLSYGGVLTSQALARNSDVFAAGVDMAGVHLWGNSVDTADVAYKSSAIAAVDGWKSPVLIWANDDDRNVEFSQTIGLVELLRPRNVYFELIVNPDDTHETLIHSRWLYVFGRMETFLQRFLINRNVSSR